MTFPQMKKITELLTKGYSTIGGEPFNEDTPIGGPVTMVSPEGKLIVVQSSGDVTEEE